MYALAGEPYTRRWVEEVCLVGARAQCDPLAPFGRSTRIDARDELADLGGGEHVRVGADLLDDLDLGRNAAPGQLQRFGPQPDDDVGATGIVRDGERDAAETDRAVVARDGAQVHRGRPD